jgi:hypothetical protein
MMYLQPKLNEDGAYYPPQSTKAPGLLDLPDEFIEEFYNCAGFVTLTTEGDAVTAIKARTQDFEAWQAAQVEEPEPAPSKMEQMRADIDYIAIMTGVEL